jgi:hypothetical protein
MEMEMEMGSQFAVPVRSRATQGRAKGGGGGSVACLGMCWADEWLAASSSPIPMWSRAGVDAANLVRSSILFRSYRLEKRGLPVVWRWQDRDHGAL